jgi:hypothetical protein
VKLWTINRVLRKLGFVLVVATDDDGVEDTELYLQRRSTYDRAAETRVPQEFKPWIDHLPDMKKWLGERQIVAGNVRDYIFGTDPKYGRKP